MPKDTPKEVTATAQEAQEAASNTDTGTQTQASAQEGQEGQASASTGPKRLGQVGYEAYAEKAGGKTYDGKDMPAWDDVGQEVQDRWEAAARAIAAEVQAAMAHTLIPADLQG